MGPDTTQRHRAFAHASVDVAALRAIANRFDASAEVIDGAVQTHLARLAFDGSTAGRAHIARGDALRTALDRLGGGLTQWSRTSVEVAGALRAAAQHYGDAELSSVARLG